ncbi:MAG TPA: hypothetical protein VFP09_05090 [Desertimonas sp.]|nr:hypothetical protein [Desertimonas sp.]
MNANGNREILGLDIVTMRLWRTESLDADALVEGKPSLARCG